MRLMLVDLPNQVSACSRALQGARADSFVVVAGNGESLLALKRSGIEAKPSHLYWDWRGLKEHCEGVHRSRLADFWSDADRLMSEAPAQTFGTAFKPMFWSSLDLIYFFDTLIMKIKEVHEMVMTLKPAVIYCGAPPSPNGRLFARSDSLYAVIAPLVGRRCNIPVVASLESEASPPTVAMRAAHQPRPLGSLIRQARRILRRRVGKVARGLRAARVSQPVHAEGPCLLAVQAFMNFAPLEKQIDVAMWLDDLPDDAAAARPSLEIAPRLADAICNLASFRNLCSFMGYEFSAIAAPRVKAFLAERALVLYAKFQRAHAKLAALRPRALLAISMGDQRARVAAAAAHHLGIVTILTPHGQIGDQKESIWRYFDLPHADHYILYTPDSKDYVQRVFSPRAHLHWAGCTRQDEVFKPKLTRGEVCERYGLSDDRPLLVYVTIPPAGNFHRIGVTVANTRSFETSCRIVDAVRANTRANVVVKGLVGDTTENAPLMSYIQGLDDHRIVYANDLGFVQFLDAADCIVLDHPAYTLSEALTRRQKLFVFNETYDWEPEAFELLREDAVFELDLDVFLNKLAAALRDGSAFAGRHPSGAFLRKWIDPYCDGRASERFADAVVMILDGEQGGRERAVRAAAAAVS